MLQLEDREIKAPPTRKKKTDQKNQALHRIRNKTGEASATTKYTTHHVLLQKNATQLKSNQLSTQISFWEIMI